MSKPVLLCLHGWGGSKESFTELRQALKGTNMEICTPDLPGFGAEPEPSTPWSVDDYANWVEQYITANHLENFQLLGHSHGGRIIIKMMTRGTVHPTHVYLCAAAGIRHPRHFKRIIGLSLAKIGRAIFSLPGLHLVQSHARKFLYKLVRVHDYEKASPLMQKTLQLVSGEDLRPLLKNIKVPTDSFWGTEDSMTPYSDALIMEKEIPNSNLHSFLGVRHRVHREKAKEIANVITTTLK